MLTSAEAPPAPDSVEASEPHLYYDMNGLEQTTDTVTITSSGTWTRSLVDTGDGTSWCTALPSSGGDQDTCTITCSSYVGLVRDCIVRFTVGTDTADVQITQWGYA